MGASTATQTVEHFHVLTVNQKQLNCCKCLLSTVCWRLFKAVSYLSGAPRFLRDSETQRSPNRRQYPQNVRSICLTFLFCAAHLKASYKIKRDLLQQGRLFRTLKALVCSSSPSALFPHMAKFLLLWVETDTYSRNGSDVLLPVWQAPVPKACRCPARTLPHAEMQRVSERPNGCSGPEGKRRH